MIPAVSHGRQFHSQKRGDDGNVCEGGGWIVTGGWVMGSRTFAERELWWEYAAGYKLGHLEVEIKINSIEK